MTTYIVSAVALLPVIVFAYWLLLVKLPAVRQVENWKNWVDAQTVEALGYLDAHPELALPSRLQYMRDLFDDMYIDLYKRVKTKYVRKPMMDYVESIDNNLVKI